MNLPEACVEVHTRPLPEEGRYAETTVVRAGQSLSLDLDGDVLSIDAARILP